MLNDTQREALVQLLTGFCPCCSAQLERCGCGEWMPCFCSSAVHACPDDEETAQIPAETMAQVVEGRL